MKKWISVADGLPRREKMGWSFSKDCYVKVGRKKKEAYYHWRDYCWYNLSTKPNYTRLIGVTHWMPKEQEVQESDTTKMP